MALQMGSQGPEVLSLQKMLRAVGYNTSEDGIFGNDTKAAILHFQSAHGLKLDGIAGPQTLAYLRSVRTGEPVAPIKTQTRAGIRPEETIIGPSVSGTDYMTYIKYGAIGLIGILALSVLTGKKK